MKLAQGEYVALEKIENLYNTHPVVAQLYVHGDSLQSYLIAIVIPDPVQLSNIASTVTGKKIAADDTPALAAACQNEQVAASVLSILTKVATQNGLKG